MSCDNANITYEQFERVCCAYLSTRDAASPTISQGSSLSWLTYARGWEWLPPFPCGSRAFLPTACLSRTLHILAPASSSSSSSDDPGDEALIEDDKVCEHVADDDVAIEREEVVTVTQTIHWSSTWRLPVLYFNASSSSGQPLSLDQLISAGIVHTPTTLSDNPDENATAGPGGASVADHPRSGLPSFFLHPCNTSQALTALLAQNEDGMQGEIAEDALYIKAFVTLCSSAVEMRAL